MLRTVWQHRRKLSDLLAYYRRHGPRETIHRIRYALDSQSRRLDYAVWVDRYDRLTAADREAIERHIGELPQRPRIAVVMPVYNPRPEDLRHAIDSVRSQIYPHWELCIADDASTEPDVAPLLRDYARRDDRIKVTVRSENGHIAAASNSALALATAEFVALLDHDDLLAPHALYMVAVEINRWPRADLIYSDEDKIDTDGRRFDPYFKSDWNPDLVLSQNMISHLGVYRTGLVRAAGGFRVGFEGSQDYDLALRIIERTAPERIRHIPFVLYHWRTAPGSTAAGTHHKSYAVDAARRAIQEHLDRTGVAARVTAAPGLPDYHRVIYPLPEPPPPVSVIIPTRDRAGLLAGCIDSLYGRTEYPSFEVIVVDNGSREPATRDYLRHLTETGRARVIPFDAPFNYAAINNLAAGQAAGPILCLLNNDIEVIAPGWMAEMVSHAVRPEVGAVGARLYYGNDTVQHAGVILGIGSVAGHGHKTLPRSHPGYFGRAGLIQDLYAVTGACLMMRKAVFEEVGGLDAANLAVAFNDVDLCLRVRQRGYRIVWTPYAELYHLESVSRGTDRTGPGAERFRREVASMLDRWGEVLAADPYYSPNLTLFDTDFGLAFPPRVTKPWRAVGVVNRCDAGLGRYSSLRRT
jgi:GT2 family glycosyltransferase